MELNQVVALRMAQIYLLVRASLLASFYVLASEGAEIAGTLSGIVGSTVAAFASWYIARLDRALVPKGIDAYFALVGLAALLLSPVWLLLGTALPVDALVVYGIFRVWKGKGQKGE